MKTYKDIQPNNTDTGVPVTCNLPKANATCNLQLAAGDLLTFFPASLFPTYPWHSLLPRYIAVPVANVNYALARFLPSV